MTAKPKQPDRRHQNPGRPSLSPTEGTRRITVRIPDSLGEKYDRNGGSPWVRKLIERAKEKV